MCLYLSRQITKNSGVKFLFVNSTKMIHQKKLHYMIIYPVFNIFTA